MYKQNVRIPSDLCMCNRNAYIYINFDALSNVLHFVYYLYIKNVIYVCLCLFKFNF